MLAFTSSRTFANDDLSDLPSNDSSATESPAAENPPPPVVHHKKKKAVKTQGTHCYYCDAQRTWSARSRNVQDLRQIRQHTFYSAPKTKTPVANAFAEVAKYSQSHAVQKMIAEAERNANSWTHKIGKWIPSFHRGILPPCYRMVKKALYDSGMAKPGSLTGSVPFPEQFGGKHSGRDALVDLRANGFVNMLDDPKYRNYVSDPKSAPVGAILVYEGGMNKNAGHTEIRTSKGFVSFDDDSRDVITVDNQNHYPHKHKLVGIMIKPSET